MKQRLGMAMSMLLLTATWTPVAHAALSDSRVETAAESRGSFLDHFSDWFATVGKSDSDKQAILAQRRVERAAKHAKEALERTADRTSDALERTAEHAGNALEDAGDKAKDTPDRVSSDVR